MRESIFFRVINLISLFDVILPLCTFHVSGIKLFVNSKFLPFVLRADMIPERTDCGPVRADVRPQRFEA